MITILDKIFEHTKVNCELCQSTLQELAVAQVEITNAEDHKFVVCACQDCIDSFAKTVEEYLENCERMTELVEVIDPTDRPKKMCESYLCENDSVAIVTWESTTTRRRICLECLEALDMEDAYHDMVSDVNPCQHCGCFDTDGDYDDMSICRDCAQENDLFYCDCCSRWQSNDNYAGSNYDGGMCQRCADSNDLHDCYCCGELSDDLHECDDEYLCCSCANKAAYYECEVCDVWKKGERQPTEADENCCEECATANAWTLCPVCERLQPMGDSSEACPLCAAWSDPGPVYAGLELRPIVKTLVLAKVED